MLKDQKFRISYNTSDHSIVKEFNSLALSNSIEYMRGVGYFTSGWLQKNAQGLSDFIQRGCKIKFITSPNLDKKDLDALQGNYDQNKLDRYLLDNVRDIEYNLQKETRNLLGWLVFDGLLEFKFAIPTKDLEGGEFHDKFGIFIDEESNYVAFNGSQNDSIKANFNYESISVFKSWGDETSSTLAEETLERFNKLWREEDDNLLIYSSSEVVKNKLYKLRTADRPYDEHIIHIESKRKKMPKIPEHIILREYQDLAYEAWQKNDFHGILSMATGSGKTITAFSSIAKLSEQTKRLAVVVVVPLQHLLEQWAEEAKLFNISFVKCFQSSQKWSPILSNEITQFQLLQQDFVFAITTNDTYTSDKFQAIIQDLDSLMLIVDEAHNFGSKKIRQKYLSNAKYRLGLSATPERHLDDEGTKAIKDYLGDIVFEYTLDEAIKSGKLTPYYYHPVLVHLTEDEQNEYIELSKKISSLAAQSSSDEDNSYMETLLIKRARIIASAENKLPVLQELIKEKKLTNTTFNLFYCAAKKDKEEDGAMRMVDKVNESLTKMGMQVKNFTSFDSSSKEERANLINNLKEEVIDGLVAIKCLDEGVDIPAVRRAFIMSSSSNPKEFIQRRGRVLRRAEGKDYAEIYDFIVVPKEDDSSESYKFNRKYLATELTRYREFARLAINYPQCEKPLMPIIDTYNLEDI